MQRNPRHFIFRDAQIEFSKFWINFMEKHDLTMSELMNILSSELQSTINICVQQEWKEARRELRESESRGQEDGGGGTTS